MPREPSSGAAQVRGHGGRGRFSASVAAARAASDRDPAPHARSAARRPPACRPQVEPGSKIKFGRVLALKQGGKFTAGQPYLEGATVEAEVLEELKAPKVRRQRGVQRLGPGLQRACLRGLAALGLCRVCATLCSALLTPLRTNVLLPRIALIRTALTGAPHNP
jgi:hypothetical protein